MTGSCFNRPLRFVLALCIGGFGGALFSYLHIPLAWMLGPMTACTIAAIAGLPIVAIERVRPFMMAIIGVLLGSGFSADLLVGLWGWIPSLLGLLVAVTTSAAIGTLYFRYVGGFDSATAFFSAMPGGLIEMIILGGEKGGDSKLIALVHSARILLVVASLPYVLIVFFDVGVSSLQPARRISVFDTPLTGEAWMVLCALAGMLLGTIFRLPAKNLLGPMLLSGAIHIVGVSNFQPAAEVVIAAQLFLGTLVGCRFAGMSPVLVLKVILLSIGSVAILVAIAVFTAIAFSSLAQISPEALFLAYSPGGLSEMSLIALSMGLDVMLVSAHHIARVLLVLLIAPFAFSLFGGRK